MAEWLRRLPAKQFPFGSVGSNPAVVVFVINNFIGYYRQQYYYIYIAIYKGPKFDDKRNKKFFSKDGGAGYRSPCPSHAKRMLYHLSYTPIQTKRAGIGDTADDETIK